EAEARAASHEQIRRDLDIARQSLGIHAPDGVQALHAVQGQARARREQLHAQRAALPEAAAAMDLAQAQQALRAASVEAEHAAQGLEAALTTLDTQQGWAQSLQAHWVARHNEFLAAGRSAQHEQCVARLPEAGARRAAPVQRCEAAQ